jgi:hypothetical protein
MTRNTIKLVLVLIPCSILGLSYLPIRYFLVLGWISFWTWLSEFGSSFCTALAHIVIWHVRDKIDRFADYNDAEIDETSDKRKCPNLSCLKPKNSI